MKALKSAAIIALVTAVPALAQSTTETQPEGAHLAELTYDSMDATGRGFIHMGDMEELRNDIFVSMDANEDNKLSEAEWLNWDFGFSNVAEELGRELAYRTALRVVFAVQDRDNDGQITQSEHRQFLATDFNRADLDHDALLTKPEYMNGFTIIVAIRTALKPE